MGHRAVPCRGEERRERTCVRPPPWRDPDPCRRRERGMRGGGGSTRGAIDGDSETATTIPLGFGESKTGNRNYIKVTFVVLTLCMYVIIHCNILARVRACSSGMSNLLVLY